MADPYVLFWLAVAAFQVIGCMTLVWKVNPYFRIIEQILIGSGTAHMMMYGLEAVRTGAIDKITKGSFTLAIPLLLGVILLSRVTPAKWLARYPTSILIGIGIGIGLIGIMEAQVLSQIRKIGDNMLGLPIGSIDWISALLAAIGSVTSLAYFIYTREHKGGLGVVSRIGRIVLMGGFGVGWGSEAGWFITSMATHIENIVRLIRGLAGGPV
jgi:hypothetical protein